MRSLLSHAAPLLYKLVIGQEAIIETFHLREDEFGPRSPSKPFQLLLPESFFVFPGCQVLGSRDKMFAQRAGRQMGLIEFDTTSVPTHANILLVDNTSSE